MEFIESLTVTQLLVSYPNNAKHKLLELRKLIIEVASENDSIKKLVETTKWGEPSYIAKTGSTIRMDWKPKTPDLYYLYFICSTELVGTFKVIFGDELTFDGNRAIVLQLCDPIPKEPIKRCLSLALNYHKIKHLHLLGA